MTLTFKRTTQYPSFKHSDGQTGLAGAARTWYWAHCPETFCVYVVSEDLWGKWRAYCARVGNVSVTKYTVKSWEVDGTKTWENVDEIDYTWNPMVGQGLNTPFETRREAMGACAPS